MHKLKKLGNVTQLVSLVMASLPNYIYQIKPTCAMHVLHSRQEQSFADPDLIKFLNLVLLGQEWDLIS